MSGHNITILYHSMCGYAIQKISCKPT